MADYNNHEINNNDNITIEGLADHLRHISENIDLLTDILPPLENAAKSVLTAAGISFDKFIMDAEESMEYLSNIPEEDLLDSNIYPGIVWKYQTKHNLYRATTGFFLEDENNLHVLCDISKETQSGEIFSFDLIHHTWNHVENTAPLTPAQDALLLDDKPEADFLVSLCFETHPVEDHEFLKYCEENKQIIDLYGMVKEFMAPDIRLTAGFDGSDILTTYLVPDNELVSGIAVYWNGERYVLCQKLEVEDFTDEEFYFVDEECGCFWLNPVAEIESKEEMAKIICSMCDHYYKDPVFCLPLSSNSYVEINEEDEVKQIISIDKTNQIINESELKALTNVKNQLYKFRESYS